MAEVSEKTTGKAGRWMDRKKEGTLTPEEELALVNAELLELDDNAPVKYKSVLDDGSFKPVKKKKIEQLKLTSASDLQAMDIQPVQFIVENILPYGLNIIASPPKSGKSFFVLNLCLAAAEGKKFLGHKVQECEVLYFALEDSLNRLNERTEKMTKGKMFPEKLYFSLECSTLGNGLEEQIEQAIKDHPGIKLVVFDTLQYIRSGSKSRTETTYQADYNEMKMIKAIASRHDISILLVHHSRKEQSPGDPFAGISGSYGINASMDCMITLTKENKSDKQTKMSICGRDVLYEDFILEFDTSQGIWNLTGTADEYREQKDYEEYDNSPVSHTIKKLVETNDGSWKGKISEIISSSSYIKPIIHDNAIKVGKDMKKYCEWLEKYDNITCQTINNGNAGKVYEFKIENPFSENQ